MPPLPPSLPPSTLVETNERTLLAQTPQGPGTSMAFALRLVDLLFGADKAKEVAGGLLVPFP